MRLHRVDLLEASNEDLRWTAPVGVESMLQSIGVRIATSGASVKLIPTLIIGDGGGKYSPRLAEIPLGITFAAATTLYGTIAIGGPTSTVDAGDNFYARLPALWLPPERQLIFHMEGAGKEGEYKWEEANLLYFTRETADRWPMELAYGESEPAGGG